MVLRTGNLFYLGFPIGYRTVLWFDSESHQSQPGNRVQDGYRGGRNEDLVEGPDGQDAAVLGGVVGQAAARRLALALLQAVLEAVLGVLQLLVVKLHRRLEDLLADQRDADPLAEQPPEFALRGFNLDQAPAKTQ